VVRAVVEAGLARIEHTLWPLASLKGVDERKNRRRKRGARDKKKSEEHY
jgi:hypothetical protein